MRNQVLMIFLLFSNVLIGQKSDAAFVGIYADGSGGMAMTELTLKEDGTFELKSPDPIFPYTYQKYESKGIWKANGGEFILNPDKEARRNRIALDQRKISENTEDSLLIKINYLLEEYEKEALVACDPFEFDLLTIYINKKKKYHHIVREPRDRICAFAPKIKNQIVIDSLSQLKLAKQKINRIGIYSYGFDEIKWFDVKTDDINRFEFTIIQPIDKERMPRSKKVIIKKRKAYFYERNGEVDTSWLANSLIKKK